MGKPETIHLLVSFLGKNYVLGTLSFNLRKGEMVYRFSYPGGARTHLNLETGQMTLPIDHITWHQGVVQMKRGDEIVDQRKYLNGPLIAGTNFISPLMVETVKLSDSPCLATEEEFEFWQGARREHVFQVNPDGDLGVILLLVPVGMATDRVLKGFWRSEKNTDGTVLAQSYLACLCNGKHCVLRFPVWLAYDVLLICSPYCQKPSHIPQAMGTSYRIPNYSHPDKGIQELLSHRQAEKIWQLNQESLDGWFRIVFDHRRASQKQRPLICPPYMTSPTALHALLCSGQDLT